MFRSFVLTSQKNVLILTLRSKLPRILLKLSLDSGSVVFYVKILFAVFNALLQKHPFWWINSPLCVDSISLFVRIFGKCSLLLLILKNASPPVYIVKHICLNIGPAVRPFVSPSVIWICNPFLNRPQVLGSFIYRGK